MGRLAFFFLAWFIPLLLLYVDPRMLGVRWSELPGLPLGTNKPVQLASSWRIIKHSAFKVACAPSGHLHLILQARTPRPREYVQLGGADLSIFVNDDLDELEVSGTRVAVGQVDTIVTAALTSQQLRRLVDLFGAADPRKVAVGIGSESMVFMSGDADGTDVRRLVSRC